MDNVKIDPLLPKTNADRHTGREPVLPELLPIEFVQAQIMNKLSFRYIRGTGERYAPTEDDIAAFEQELGCRLPNGYRAFLRNYGITGFDEDVTFPIAGRSRIGSEDRLWVWYGLGPGDAYDIRQKCEDARSEMPGWFLPIACTDSAQAEICLSLRPDEIGCVYIMGREQIWDYAEADEAARSDLSKFAAVVADSFTAFLSSLTGLDPVHKALRNGDLAELRRLVESGHSLDGPDKLGRLLCENTSDPDLLRLLLDRGAPMGLPLNDMSSHTLESVRLLIERGLEINRADSFGSTPLHSAAFYSSPEIVKLLLEHGADPSVTNHAGNRPIDEARRLDGPERAEVIRMLMRAMK